MVWKKFPYPSSTFVYTPSSLKDAWIRLHAGDAEPLPDNPTLVDAWIAYHAGEFEKAINLGLSLGVDGYSVANKANSIYANYLEKNEERKLKLYSEISSRCDVQQSIYPSVASGYYWQAYALGRYSQSISILKSLAQGIGTKVKDCLDKTIELEPKHADAHTALGLYHAEIISKVGALIGAMTYGVNREDSIDMFKKALKLNPDSAIARIEYANGLVMLDGKDKIEEALLLYRKAAAFEPKDAMERLDVQMAMDEIDDA